MEEVHESSRPEDGQFQSELPEPLTTPEAPPYAPPVPAQGISRAPNTTSMRNANLEASYDINTLPRPQEVPTQPAAVSPEQVEQAANPETPEIEFDKRNERLRQEPRQQDELAAAGMMALGDVLKNRQQAAYSPLNQQTGTLPAPAPKPTSSAPLTKTGPSWSLYQRAVVVGILAALVTAPVVIYILASR